MPSFYTCIYHPLKIDDETPPVAFLRHTLRMLLSPFEPLAMLELQVGSPP